MLARATPPASSSAAAHLREVAGEQRTPPASSSAIGLKRAERAASPTPPALSIVTRNKKQFAMACADPRVIAIERARAQRKISQTQFLALAGVHRSTWESLRRGAQAPRPRTLERLSRALDGAPAKATAPQVAIALRALIAATEALVLATMTNSKGQTNKLLLEAINPAKNGKKPRLVLPSRIRAIAVYLVTVELEIENAELARALGCKRQNIPQVRAAIEDLREDPRAEELLAQVAAQLKGRAA